MGIVTGLIGGAAAAGLSLWATSRAAPAARGADGWQHLRPRGLVHGTVAGGAALTGLFAGVLLTGGSQRADAAQQNMALWALLIGFCLLTLATAWQAYATRVSWRGRRLRVCTPLRTAEYDMGEIAQCRKLEFGDELALTLRDGRRLTLSSYHSGMAEFEEALVRAGVRFTR